MVKFISPQHGRHISDAVWLILTTTYLSWEY